jgi:hypothetical protein
MSATAISETVSKKRGRPAAFDRAWINQIATVFPALTSDRQIQAKAYEVSALGAIGRATADTFAGVEAIVKPCGPHRATILEQLGRLQRENDLSDEDVLFFATELSKTITDTGITVRESVARLKGVRRSYRRLREAT